MKAPTEEPFVGPYPLDRSHRIYGRDREVIELANLLSSERVFLLYAPSGAGKTSLIEAGLVESLCDRGFTVHGTIRLNEDPDDKDVNRFRYSMLRSLERDPDRLRLGKDDLREMSIAEYLGRRLDQDDEPASHVLIFDQFEEVLAFDSHDEPAKECFLAQLGQALEPVQWWALFSIREDYLGAFDRYRRYLPNQLSSSMRLDLLRRSTAREAIVRPAHDAALDFSDDAADLLVRQLMTRQHRLPPDDDGESKTMTVESPLIEPLELQVVCRKIWHDAHEGPSPPTSIEKSRIHLSGGVDKALIEYYDEEVARSAEASGGQVRERQVRDWIGERLVTKEGVRRIVQYGPAKGTLTEDDKALQYLLDVRLVGKLPRDQVTWLELAHDRLAPRVLARNESWYEKDGEHLTQFERSAWLWRRSRKRTDMLLGDSELAAVADDHPDESELRGYEKDYLDASRDEARHRRRRRLVGILVACFLLFSLGGLILGLVVVNSERNSANRARDAAEAQRLAGDARATDDTNLGLLLGIEAIDAEPGEDEHVVDAESALYQANGSSRVLRALDSASGEEVAGPELASGADRSLVVATADGDVELVPDVLDGGVAPTVEFSLAGDPTALAVSPTGSIAVVTRGTLVVDGVVDDEVAVGEARTAVFVDDSTLALVLSDGSVMIYDTTDAEVARSISVPGGATTALALDDRSLAVGTATGEVLTVDIATGDADMLLASPSPADTEMAASVTALALDDTGSLLAVARDDLSIRVQPADPNGADVVELNATQVPATAMAFVGDGSFDGPAVAIAAQDVVRVADAITGADLFVLSPATGEVSDIVAVSADAIAVATQNGAVAVWDTTIGHGAERTTAVRATSSTEVLTAGTGGRVLAWQVTDDAVRAGGVVPGAAEEAVIDLAVSGDRVAAAAGATVRVIEPGVPTRELEHESAVRLVRFGQGPTRDVVTAGDRWIRLWGATESPPVDLVVDPDDAAAVMSPGTQSPVYGEGSTEPTIVDIAVYAEQLFVLLPDRRVATWGLNGGTPGMLEPPPNDAAATALVVTRNGLVAIGDDDGDVTVLDQDGELFGDPIGRSLSGAVTALAVSPQDHLAVAFGDHTVEVWTLATQGKGGEFTSYELDVRIPSRSRVRDIAFVERSGAEETRQYIVIATDDGRLVIQPLDVGELRSVAEDKASRDLTPRECERFEVSC